MYNVHALLYTFTGRPEKSTLYPIKKVRLCELYTLSIHFTVWHTCTCTSVHVIVLQLLISKHEVMCFHDSLHIHKIKIYI